MAATRKLQGEIDRCLKKVSEGVETFEDIWQKVHNASNTNQKEKYETDLKKEIKKLQRLRDQIKSWIASGEIKDKSMLVDTRKLIETQMERFKVVERETKTKAYSKEGLGAAQKLDPTTREREEINNWIISSIDQLQIQIDQFESEIESLMVNKKKRLDKDKQDRLDELKNNMDRHKFHMSKLETLMRMLDNLANDINTINGLRKFLSQVRKIKDDIEYYLESSQEPEFEENEFLYDDIEGLDEVEQQQALGNMTIPTGEDLVSSPSTSGLNSPISPIHSSDGGNGGASAGSEDPSQEVVTNKSSDDSSKVIRPFAVKQQQSSADGSGEAGVKDSAVSNSSPQKSLGGTPNNSSPSSGLSNHVSSLSSLSSSPTTQNHGDKSIPGVENTIDAPSSVDLIENNNNTNNNNNSSSANGNGNQSSESPENESNTNEEVGSSLLSSISGSNVPVIPTSIQQQIPTSNEPINTTISSSQHSTNININNIQTNGGLEDDTHLTNSAVSQSSAQNSIVPGVQSVSEMIRFQHEQMLDRLMQGDGSESMATLKSIAQEAIDRINLNGNNNNQEKKMMEAHIPPLLGVAPMGPVPLGKDHQHQFQMLEASSYHMPLPSDSERTRQFLPRNPFPTPHYYPQNPLTNSDTLEFFQRLSIETLFFIFYYLEGTKAQYLAAKVLKKQSWRFHTKYMMWFQRHEEPKVINEEYEQGTYIYFDIEKWGQRKKDGFVFEYRYLEDRDLC